MTRSKALEEALEGDLVLIDLGDRLLRRAVELFELGYGAPTGPGSRGMRIAPHQMAALADLVRHAGDLEEAKAGVRGWLRSRLARLEGKAQRTGRTSAWLHRVTSAGEDGPTLGERLIQWVEEEEYLGAVVQKDLRLRVLKRAFHTFHGLYRLSESAIRRGEEVPRIHDPQPLTDPQEDSP